jgi:hypothetical protein
VEKSLKRQHFLVRGQGGKRGRMGDVSQRKKAVVLRVLKNNKKLDSNKNNIITIGY